MDYLTKIKSFKCLDLLFFYQDKFNDGLTVLTFITQNAKTNLFYKLIKDYNIIKDEDYERLLWNVCVNKDNIYNGLIDFVIKNYEVDIEETINELIISDKIVWSNELNGLTMLYLKVLVYLINNYTVNNNYDYSKSLYEEIPNN